MALSFLSTLSLRRATFANFDGFTWWVISIHALLAESDVSSSFLFRLFLQFLSTLSLRRATTYLSILFQKFLNFYPRSPCGERRWLRCWQLAAREFLSTLSLRRATLDAWKSCHVCRISIHALLAESDNSAYGALDGASISIHALLAESDLGNAGAVSRTWKFLSTLSLRRATIPNQCQIDQKSNFYPRSPCGERPGKSQSS